jgi:hypothetical protein
MVSRPFLNILFSGCASLANIRVPDAVGSIGFFTFDRCGALTEIDLPDSLMSIGDRAFWGCTSLTRIAVPNSVKEIGEGPFVCCSSLAIVRLPKNPNLAIGGNAFLICNALTTLQLPRMELAVWPCFLEQFNDNHLFARIGLTGEVGRKTCAFFFLRRSVPQLFEDRRQSCVDEVTTM